MRAQLADELIQLSPAEKRELGEALIASADADTADSRQLTDVQRTELRARLTHHRANPGEPGITLQELKTKLLGARA